MRYILREPKACDAAKTYPLWVVLHGAFAHAEQAAALFAHEADARHAFVLAPEATRSCGDGFCWSFANDARAVGALLMDVQTYAPIDPRRIALIGYSMGCTMGCWLVAQHPSTFGVFAALCMGSAFEPWEHDDGGIDRAGLRAAVATTRILLAVDRRDPYGPAEYFQANRAELQALGFTVATCQPDHGTHDITDEMRAAVMHAMT